MHYWDTSALVKLYLSEPDSPQFAIHSTLTSLLLCSELTRWELFRVLVRKEAEGMISPGGTHTIYSKFLSDVSTGKIRLTPMDRSLESRFQQMVSRLHSTNPPLLVRTFDGIHLASADLHGATELVATDTNLRKCSTAVGLKLFP
jgi:predicted nucleic acid-binding protein